MDVAELGIDLDFDKNGAEGVHPVPFALGARCSARPDFDDVAVVSARECSAAVDAFDTAAQRRSALAERDRRGMDGRPVLEAVMKPAEIGFSGKSVSPSSNRIRVTGTLRALAATCLKAVKVRVPSSRVAARTTIVRSGASSTR